MQKIAYRLAALKLRRYEIIEKNDGQLFWKSHKGLGSLKKGRWQIKGSLLFLEPGETEPSSHMKSKLVQQLIRLPDWERTKYFCTSYVIYFSKTCAICRRLGTDKDLKRNDAKNVIVMIDINFNIK